MNGLLSLEALAWLKSQNYSETDHETRMKLIAEAREKYPADDDEYDEEEPI